MPQRGFENAVLAVAPLLLAHIVNGLFPLITELCRHGIDRCAEQNTGEHFVSEQLENERCRSAAGQKDRQHLVRGGEKHREQRAAGDDTAGIKVGGRGGKAALRDHAERRAQHGTPASGAVDKRHRLFLGAVLNKFNCEIRRKQKRQQFQTVEQRIEQSVKQQRRILPKRSE